jgi:hypothetical protein
MSIVVGENQLNHLRLVAFVSAELANFHLNSFPVIRGGGLSGTRTLDLTILAVCSTFLS